MSWKKFVEEISGGIPHSDRIFIGLKIAQFGFLGSVLGAFFLFSGFQQVGQLLTYIGAAVFVIGMLTFFLMSIFKDK